MGAYRIVDVSHREGGVTVVLHGPAVLTVSVAQVEGIAEPTTRQKAIEAAVTASLKATLDVAATPSAQFFNCLMSWGRPHRANGTILTDLGQIDVEGLKIGHVIDPTRAEVTQLFVFAARDELRSASSSI